MPRPYADGRLPVPTDTWTKVSLYATVRYVFPAFVVVALHLERWECCLAIQKHLLHQSSLTYQLSSHLRLSRFVSSWPNLKIQQCKGIQIIWEVVVENKVVNLISWSEIQNPQSFAAWSLAMSEGFTCMMAQG